MQSTNQIGGRGENAAQWCFLRPVHGHNGFEPTFLGEKAQLLDLRVALLNPEGKAFGPHFYVQAKTHQARRGRRFPARFTAEEVGRAKAGLVPVYVVGVELDGDTKENVWICGIDAQASLPSIPKAHDLRAAATLIQLYDEVQSHFNRAAYSFVTNLK